MATEEILPLVDRFVSGADNGYEAAMRLKDRLAETFSEDSYVERLVVDLSLYRPGGGPGHYDFEQMRERLVSARNYLANAI